MSDKNLPSWRFAEVPIGIKNRNPVQDEFFNSSEALTEISSLIRESIQNSLDANISDSKIPVSLKFTLGSLDKSVTNKYFHGLQKHLSVGIPGSKNPLDEKRCNYLIVEDFNTSGLLGDSRKDQLSVGDTPSDNSYHFFVWAEGSSAKNEGNRGRWGIGKIVFPRLSNIKTFFVLSKRNKINAPCGREEILIGMSTLKGHALDGKNYQPDGWWANYDNVNSVPGPVDNFVIEDFKLDWGVKRTSQNGLSILIPYIPAFINKDLIRDCVIREYFIAIIQGLLEVEISDHEKTYVLSKDNLRRECENLGEEERIVNSKSRDEMLCLIDIVAETRENTDCKFNLQISEEFPNSWNSLNFDPKDADSAVNLLDTGQTVSCNISLTVPSRQGSEQKDSYRVYIRRVQDARASAVFSREGIVIPSANSNLIRDHLILVIINSGPLANLLADAEGPAHEKWSEKTDKFRQNYPPSKGTQVLKFVKKSPIELLFKIRGSGTEKDSTTFSSFFPLPGSLLSGNIGKSAKSREEGDRPDDSATLNFTSNPKSFLVDESPNGFSIKSTGDNPTLIGKKIYLNIAYKVRSGDAFSKWQIEDFDLSKNKPRLDGTLLKKVSGNKAILEITGRKFKAVWGGFDPLRDLDIKADLTELDEIS